MTRRARTLTTGAGIIAAASALALLLAPPASRPVAPGEDAATVRGVLHVHTNRSDGSGDLDEIAAAAARAGLDFVILADHGDGAMAPEPPGYRSGVLLIDGLEISTNGGHVLALGAVGAGYPLGGEARAVVEDVTRLGGLALAAHPASPREELRWLDWTLPVGGIEWLNVDSAWRDESLPSLARALLTYPVRPAEVLAELLDRPVEVLDRWDGLTATRRVVAVAAVDAHARVGLSGGGEPRSALGLALPSYETAFGLVTIGLPETTLGFEAEMDAAAVLSAIRAGHVYSSVDALAGPGTLTFSATSGGRTVRSGDLIDINGPVSLNVIVNGPDEGRIDLRRDGVIVASGTGRELAYEGGSTPGVYRVEVGLPWAPGDPPITWMLSNPIYVGKTPVDGQRPDVRMTDAIAGPSADEWNIETSTGSEGAIDVVDGLQGGQEALLRFALSGRLSDEPYVAYVASVEDAFVARDRMSFSVRADRSMRVDVQVRTATPQPGGGDAAPLGERWHRSVYVDEDLQNVTVRLEDLLPKGPTDAEVPVSAAIDSLLFVVDTVNTAVGTGGRIWVSNLRFGAAVGERARSEP
jgi:hypothetical protein